jgi:hypothetical protein
MRVTVFAFEHRMADTIAVISPSWWSQMIDFTQTKDKWKNWERD